ncbi:hypothetical protein L9F63_024832, partial [Diploptera punctata]
HNMSNNLEFSIDADYEVKNFYKSRELHFLLFLVTVHFCVLWLAILSAPGALIFFFFMFVDSFSYKSFCLAYIRHFTFTTLDFMYTKSNVVIVKCLIKFTYHPLKHKFQIFFLNFNISSFLFFLCIFFHNLYNQFFESLICCCLQSFHFYWLCFSFIVLSLMTFSICMMCSFSLFSFYIIVDPFGYVICRNFNISYIFLLFCYTF